MVSGTFNSLHLIIDTTRLPTMLNLRKLNKSVLFAWVILLCLALLCAQEVKLHTHNLGHDHVQEHSHISVDTSTEHSHLTPAHLSIDSSHADHHDKLVSETDITPDTVLKNISSKTIMLAIFFFILSLLLPGYYRLSFWRRKNDTVFSKPYKLLPLLRAPPL